MKRFRRPGLFMNWLEVAVWALLTGVMYGGAVLGAWTGIAPGIVAGVFLGAVWTYILWRKFSGRVSDIRAVEYKTRHGVSVIFRGMSPLPQMAIEEAHERAIAAHGHAEALDGYALVVQWGPLYANAERVMGVTDGGYMNVDASAGKGAFTYGTIRHEAARAILLAHGLSVPEQDKIMQAMGTY